MKTKTITATVVYSMSVELEIDPTLLETDEGIETVREKLKDEADFALSDGATPVIHEASDDRLVE